MKATGLMVLMTAVLGGCASIVSGVSQPVSVETRSNGESVAGAACKLTSNKGTWFVTTPSQVILHRGFQDLAIECSRPGLEPSLTVARSHVRPIFFGNLLFGGLIGIAVDLGDGAAFDYDDLITIDMFARPTVGGLPVPTDSSVATPVAAQPPAPRQPGPEPVATPVAAATPVPVAASSNDPRVARTFEPTVPPMVPPNAAAASAPLATAQAPMARTEKRYLVAAERYARAQSCSATPVATLTAVGPGSETYAIPCASGEALIARCDYGNCRALH